MNIMSFWLEKAHLKASRTNATPPLSELFSLSINRKEESAGKGMLTDGKKNFSVHRTHINFSRRRKRVPEAELYALRGLLPQNVPDTTQPDDDVYTFSTRRGRMQVDGALSGRSMVEMLGVLAIIGVLSVGAISGYQKAMFKYKLNKQTEQISTILDYTLHNIDILTKAPVMMMPLLAKLGVVPVEMIKSNSPSYAYDALNTKIWLENHKISSANGGYALGLTIYNNSGHSMEICRNLLTLAKLRSPYLSFTYIQRFNSDDTVDSVSRRYGDKDCKGNNCIRNMTLSDMDDLCRVCQDAKECHVFICFDYKL